MVLGGLGGDVLGGTDNEADGDVDYYITAMPVISEDAAYKALAPAQVKLTNLDDPARSVRVSMTPTACTTTELNAGECQVTLTVTGWYSGSNQFNQARYRLPFQKLTVTLDRPIFKTKRVRKKETFDTRAVEGML